MYKRVQTFIEGISPEVNVKVRLQFESAYYNITD